MNHPQSLAEELYKHFPTEKLKAIKNSACCIFTLFWYLDLDFNDTEAIMTVSDLINSKALDPDCTVYWNACIKQLTGRELISLEKVKISNIKCIKEKTIVKFSKDGYSHWVGAENGKVVFNSLKYSKCVSEGKPTEARIIKITGI